MTRVAAILALAGTLFWCDALPGRPTEAERYVRPDQVEDFDPLFATHCAGCHGAEGMLGPARMLADPLYLVFAGEEVLRATITGGVPGTPMTAFAQAKGGPLTEAQVDVLARGLVERWGEGETRPADLPAYAQPPGASAARGRRDFERFCGECHGADGQGAEAGSVVDPNFLQLASDQLLRTTIVVGRPDLGMPDWQSGEDRPPMTARNVADVVAYLAGLRPDAAAPGP